MHVGIVPEPTSSSLVLGGAGCRHDDAEGELLRRVREELAAANDPAAPLVPVVVTLDLHANVSDEMVR